MNEIPYTLRIFPESSPFYSFVSNGACEVEFATALAEARARPACDTWYITNMESGVIVALHDAAGDAALLWRNYRRSELEAQRRTEVEQRLEARIIEARIALERDIRRCHTDIVKSSSIHPSGRLWRTMRRNMLHNAIVEAVLS